MLSRLVKNLRFSTKTVPIFFLGVSVLAFGLLTLKMGYFQDDWTPTYYFSREGVRGIARMDFADSRPFTTLIHLLFFNMVGLNPLNWHVLSMLFRFGAALLFWLDLNLIFKNHSKQNALVALMFLIYPVFLLQPMAMTYSLHWAMYFVFMLSLFFMLQAAEKPKYYFLFTCTALALQIFHLLMIEYYVGIELARLIFLWLLFKNQDWRARLTTAVKQYLPYFLSLVGYIVFRSSYLRFFGRDRNAPSTVFSLFSAPLDTLRFIFQSAVQDTIQILFGSWSKVLDPAAFDFSIFSSAPLWIVVILSVAAIWCYFHFLEGESFSNDENGSWSNWLLITGFIMVALSLFPAWAVSISMFQANSPWNQRFALASMSGAGMFWAGLIFKFVQRESYRYFVFAVMISLAIGLNLQTQNQFKQAWEKQLQFYWQLYWRAPALKQNTLVTTDSEYLGYMGYYPTAFAINVLYPQKNPQKISYWFDAGSEHINWADFNKGIPSHFSKYATKFDATKRDIVAMTFEPELQHCLWVLRPSYDEIPVFSEQAYQLMSASNLSNIQATTNNVPLAPIFGNEPAHTWCYFYEKADLASQSADWPGIIKLWEEANKNGFRPRVSIEFIPFIEAYAYTEKWENARVLTFNATSLPPRAPSMFCTLWNNIESATSSGAERDQTIKYLKSRLGCQHSPS
jgi:hypothetical protein